MKRYLLKSQHFIRYLTIVLIILLYSVPFYLDYIAGEKKADLAAMEVADDAFPLSNDRPFYSEDFVYQASPGSMCHVSSISPSGENKMACTWYAGSREGAKDVAIYFAVFDEVRRRWNRPVVLVDRKQCSRELNRHVKKLGNPLISQDKEGRLWLFYSSVFMGGWSGSSINYKVSLDGGNTWSKSEKMFLSPFLNLTQNVKNKGINFKNGSFLLPVYHEFMKKFSQIVWVIPEEDRIRYKIRKMTQGEKAIQPSLIYTEKNQIAAFFRNMGSEQKNYILASDSDDLGQTWTELGNTTLPNPNSGFDMIKLSDGSYLGVINDSFYNRGNLTMVISYDQGHTWESIKVLESAYGKRYSYPSMSRSTQGFYHLTYTYEGQKIKHIVFNETWLKQLMEQSNGKIF